MGKLNKSMKAHHPPWPWGPKEFFTGPGYYTHNTEGYVPKPESLRIPSRPPPAEQTADYQPFFHVPRNPGDPHTRVDVASGSVSLTAVQLIEQETLRPVMLYPWPNTSIITQACLRELKL